MILDVFVKTYQHVSLQSCLANLDRWLVNVIIDKPTAKIIDRTSFTGIRKKPREYIRQMESASGGESTTSGGSFDEGLHLTGREMGFKQRVHILG